MFMVRALQDEECIASYLVFESGSFLTNYLSGHKVTANSTYAKYKVIWDLVVYGVGKGMSHYNLGGGRPSLLAFKSGFSNEIRPFYLGKRIILPQVYKDLLAIIGARSDESQFFPGYRTPELYPELM
jgi:lipid II:glycine glycyltransferase (peptidoglycan interpeptide bridge formation enzyme)